MSLYEASLRLEIQEAEIRIANGQKPRNVFERVIFNEARDRIAARKANR